ncbi:IS30 family transposase [Nocardia colli]|uniref:IS30 family transposase n=2 Tax=Nocardia colli TaxID=2545717 RepID=A0A5N0DK98_9NOCA|nr:IS30 family transposase [Nocardia colli]
MITPPRTTGPRPRLSFAEREEIAVGVAAGESIRSMARRLGRSPSTVWREIGKNGTKNHAHAAGRARYRRIYRFGARRSGAVAVLHYRAGVAHARYERRARRMRPGKLATSVALRAAVQDGLDQQHSPEQITGWLRLNHPNCPEMQVSHETIYKALYVQGRGALRRELVSCLRTGRALRKPRAGVERRGQRDPLLNISNRPPEAIDRAVPGNWEGDLITGAANGSAIGTLVERRSGFVILLHLPEDHTAESVATQAITKMGDLPGILRRTLTWDQGSEMAQHARITTATGIRIYFCDPHSPWQRGTNENTNGLLRQYFPKGTDLSVFPADYLDHVALKLNTRPRKRHGFRTPLHILNDILTEPPTVASTA